MKRPKTTKYVVGAILFGIVPGMPLVLAGLFCCATVIGIPLGMTLIALSGIIPSQLLARRIKIIVQWDSHGGLVEKTTEGDVPWIV